MVSSRKENLSQQWTKYNAEKERLRRWQRALMEEESVVFKQERTCAYCGHHLRAWNYQFKHVNIEQVPVTHYFCSKKCREEWSVL